MEFLYIQKRIRDLCYSNNEVLHTRETITAAEVHNLKHSKSIINIWYLTYGHYFIFLREIFINTKL